VTGLTVLLLGALALPARSQDPAGAGPDPSTLDEPVDEALADPLDAAAPRPWYVGLPVGQVSLEAPFGGLPRENLEPLLRVAQGQTYAPALVRQDIALLMRAGDFASVEVDLEPWLEIDAQGEPLPAVRVVYRVYPPTRVERVEITGVRGAARKLVQQSAGLDRGEAFFPRRDAPAAARRIRDALVAGGFPEAQVQVEEQRLVENRVGLRVQVRPGPARELEDVVLAPSLPLTERRLRKALRRADLARGRRVTSDAEVRGREVVRQLLVEEGYLDPRVTLLFSRASDGREVLAVLGEVGARTEVAATGVGAPSSGRLREILGLQAGVRLSEGTVEDTVATLRRWYQARGWYEVRIQPRLERSGEDALLVLAVERGRRFKVGEHRVEGAVDLPAATISAALREAAPDSLGRKVLVDGVQEGAARAVEELYRGQGFLSARVQLGQPEEGPGRWRFPAGRRVRLILPVTIEEGPRTTLVELTVEGLDTVGADRVARAQAELVDQPLRPARLDALRQEVVEELRALGYLSADADIDLRRVGDQAHATLRVSPGLQARLRSVVIQGNRRTRRAVLAREVAAEIGEPLSPEALEETRRRLYELDVFRVVNVELVGEDERARDLIVRVEERPPILLELAGGVATDRGAQARARVAHRNLAGLGHRISLLGEAGYAWLGDSWQLDLLEPVWRAAVRYEAPNLPARGQRLFAEVVLNEVVQEPTFRTSDIGGSVGVQVRLAARSEAVLSYGGRLRTLEDVDPGALVDGDPWLAVLGLTQPPRTELDLRDARRLLTGPSLAVVLDERDDPLDPRQGWRATGLLHVSDGLISSPASVRAEGRLDELLPVGPVVLALGLSGGLGWAQGSANTLAVEERFYLGGSGSLRGFRPGTVGPANRVPRANLDFPSGIDPFLEGITVPADPSRWVMTGADAAVLGSVELRVPLASLGVGDFEDTWLVGFGDLGRAAFLGAGVQPTSRAEGLDPALRYGLGGGIRLSTAIGPVSLLLGANPAPLVERDESPFVVHFNLGDL
jgi:outer membrane protein insertion porin family